MGKKKLIKKDSNNGGEKSFFYLFFGFYEFRLRVQFIDGDSFCFGFVMYKGRKGKFLETRNYSDR